MNLWKFSDENQISQVNASKTLAYVDLLNVRQSEESSCIIKVNGEGIAKWKDPSFRRVYRHIFEGQWQNYDPFEIDYRTQTESGSFFPAFKGLISMTDSMTTMKVLPMLRESTSLWILRPFLSDVPSDVFPGCFPGTSK